MARRLFHRCFVALALVLATASFGFPRDEAPSAVSQKSTVRVTRHFAAGLEYLLVEPRDVAPNATLPLVVFLHGRSSAPEAPTGPFLELSMPVRVILPRGPLRSGDAYAWMPVSAHGGESDALVGPLVERMRELTEAMAVWRERHPTRGLPIVTGFSQGGILAATLAVTHPEAVYRAFPVAGWIPSSLAPRSFDPLAPHVPVHALHGADDRVIGAARTRRQLTRLRELGYPVEYEAIEGVGHELHPAMQRRLAEAIDRALREQPEASDAGGLS